MNRRHFLQVAGLAGLAVMAPTFTGRTARADNSKFKGPYWIMLNAAGGWDPTSFCDPKGGAIDTWYTPDQIKGVSGTDFKYAPLRLTTGDTDELVIFDSDEFWNKNFKRMRVFNGVDNQTNNHDAGTRTTWSGNLSDGYPAFAALVAGAAAAQQTIPLAFISNGGFDATEGVVSLTRVGDANSLAKIAHPNIINPGDNMPSNYLSNATASRIIQTQNARLAAMKNKARLPVLNTAMNELFLARAGDDGLAALADEFTNYNFDKLSNLPGLGAIDDNNGDARDLNSLMQQVQVAMLAFKAGVAVSANINIGGFDTHSNHDANHLPQAAQLLRAYEYILDKLQAMGLDNVYLIAGSDFARTPTYNPGKGKDHWNITSVLMSGPEIGGGRVVGSTDAGQTAIGIDEGTLAPNPSGTVIGTNHIHLQLRKLAGIDQSAAALEFGIAGDDIPLLK